MVTGQQFKKEGIKFDSDKPRFDLIPIYPLQMWAQVLTFGASKYEDRNWELGMDWSRVYAAAQRHLTYWWDGWDHDAETGLSHLAHALCCISFLLEYSKTKAGKDDRPKGWLTKLNNELKGWPIIKLKKSMASSIDPSPPADMDP